MSLSPELQRAVDAGELVFPIDIRGDGSQGLVTRGWRGQVCTGSPGARKLYDLQEDSYFERRRGGTVPHGGVDIFAGEGVYCYAIEDGIAKRVPSDNAGAFGLTLRGRHGVWLYSHMSDAFPSDGQRVRAGDRIGRVGREGNARRNCPHLHFGWRLPNGTARGGPHENPTDLLRALEREAEDSEGPTVDGDQSQSMEQASRAIALAERLLLDVAEQWEDGGTRESRRLAESLRSVVATSRAEWRSDPERVLVMLKETATIALQVRSQHPEWFDRPGIMDDIQRALMLAREALEAALGAGAAFAMDFGMVGLGLVLLLAFGAGRSGR